MSVNKVIILGRVGKKPELRHTPSGASVTSFGVATSEKYKDKNTNEYKENTEWHNVVVWGKTAENVSKYIDKGRQLFIEGKLSTRKWQDKDGNDKYTTEIIASTVQFLGDSKSESNAPKNSSNNELKGFEIKEDSFSSDDIPF